MFRFLLWQKRLQVELIDGLFLHKFQHQRSQGTAELIASNCNTLNREDCNHLIRLETTLIDLKEWEQRQIRFLQFSHQAKINQKNNGQLPAEYSPPTPHSGCLWLSPWLLGWRSGGLAPLVDLPCGAIIAAWIFTIWWLPSCQKWLVPHGPHLRPWVVDTQKVSEESLSFIPEGLK